MTSASSTPINGGRLFCLFRDGLPFVSDASVAADLEMTAGFGFTTTSGRRAGNMGAYFSSGAAGFWTSCGFGFRQSSQRPSPFSAPLTSRRRFSRAHFQHSRYGDLQEPHFPFTLGLPERTAHKSRDIRCSPEDSWLHGQRSGGVPTNGRSIVWDIPPPSR